MSTPYEDFKDLAARIQALVDDADVLRANMIGLRERAKPLTNAVGELEERAESGDELAAIIRRELMVRDDGSLEEALQRVKRERQVLLETMIALQLLAKTRELPRVAAQLVERALEEIEASALRDAQTAHAEARRARRPL